MQKRFLTIAIVVGIAAAVIAFAIGPAAEAQDKPNNYKNLQFFPKDVPKKKLKARMKVIAKATGRTCDDCHDTDDFSKDTAKKKIGRKMMKLTRAANRQLKKDGIKHKIDCVTCHQGKPKPSK